MFWSLVMVVKKNQLFNHPDTYALDHGSVWHHADKEQKASPGLDLQESCAKNPTYQIHAQLTSSHTTWTKKQMYLFPIADIEFTEFMMT